MKLRYLAMAACFLLSAAKIASPVPASAAVQYSFYYGDGTDIYSVHFTYIASSFVTNETKVDNKDLAYCGSPLFPCESITFSPNSTEFSYPASDQVTLRGDSPLSGSVTEYFRFPLGAFSAVGHYVISEEIAPTLDVSIVPLPAAAPLFGAALATLAGLGYTAKRKKAAASD